MLPDAFARRRTHRPWRETLIEVGDPLPLTEGKLVFDVDGGGVARPAMPGGMKSEWGD